MKIFISDNLCTIYKLVLHRLQNQLGTMHNIVDSPEKADLLIAGICAAFEADEARSLKIIDDFKKTGKPVYAFGCMTKVSPEKIGLKNLYASWESDRLVGDLCGHIFPSKMLPDTFRNKSDYRVFNPKKRFIGISTGCSFECSYCPHKKGAGELKSIPRLDILDSVRGAVKEWCHSIVLTGIDTACYGEDVGYSFSDLLRDILDISPEYLSINISQFNPEGLYSFPGYDSEILNLFRDSRIKDIQLPIQTASERILQIMDRYYSIDNLDSFLTLLTRHNPSVFLRTDIMVGFPGETMDDIEETIDFVKRHFDEAAVYVFEMKRGTPIEKMGLSLIPADLAKFRLDYTVTKLINAGVFVHGGGQRIETLIANDKIKESHGKP